MNCLITQSGRRINKNGSEPHTILCKNVLGISLREFLSKKHRGIRVLIDGEHAAIEGYTKPNSQQAGKIRSILRRNDIFDLVTSFRGDYNVRSTFNKPIRRI